VIFAVEEPETCVNSLQRILTSLAFCRPVFGDGSTDLRLDTSTKLKMENYWCD
jgi:hypothetical protein